MAGEWREARFGDIAEVLPGKYIPASDYDPDGQFVIFGSNSVMGRARAPLYEGPIIAFARIGSNCGSTMYSSGPCWINNNAAGIRGLPGTDTRFLYYWMQSFDFAQIREGSGQPFISDRTLKDQIVFVPPLPEQRAIARILGTLDDDIQAKGGECKGMRRILAHLINKLVSGAWSVEQGQEWLAWARSLIEPLDDKIELNRRMNETLEAMARAIFKSWFVDFDPVRAKCRGERFSAPTGMPGLPKHIADLFPDSFEDSELGEIPKGWEVKPVGDLAEVVGGSTPSTKQAAYWDGGTHAWATPKDLSALSVPVLLETGRRISDAGLSQISSGLLPKGTVLLSSRAPIGYLAVAEIPVAINQGFIAMKPKPGMSNIFLLLWASVAQEEIVNRANGSTFLEISKANFRPIPLVVPPARAITAFDRMARPAYERIVENERESRTLAALRDALLPQLISGRLRVKDAEKFIGRAL